MKPLELSHDIIAKKIWERLPEIDKQLQKVKRDLVQRQKDYAAEKGSLLGPKELAAWEAAITRLEDSLVPEVKTYIADSRTKIAADARKAEEEAKKEAQRKRTRIIAGILSVFFVMAVALAVWAYMERNAAKSAEQKAAAAEQHALSEKAEADKARQVAEEQKRLANIQEQIALVAKDKADSLRISAEQQTELAKQAQALAIAEKEKAEEALEGIQIAEAEKEQLREQARELEAEVSESQQALAEFRSSDSISMILNPIVEKMEKDSLFYSSQNMQDASGIVLRILEALKKKKIPILGPTPNEARASRQIARWYADRQSLAIIQDPLQERNLITPGTILFFGKAGQTFTDLTIESLTGGAQFNSRQAAIQTLGVVTEVQRTQKGELTGYVLMHGQRPGKIAQRTYYHSINPPRDNLPVLGNWNQQLVAIAFPFGKPQADGSIAQLPPPPDDDEPPTGSSPVRGQDTKGSSGYNAQEVSRFLSLRSEKMEGEKLMYSSQEPAKLLDSSGILHRLLQALKEKYAEIIAPMVSEARSSRQIARWYHEKGALTIVQDAMSSRNLIKPGAIMFFGRSGMRFSNLAIGQLTDLGSRAISHIGMVTEVKTDDKGNVIGYSMMQGRRPGVHAQRSHYHQIEPPRPGFPILGNWNQQWVAIAFPFP